MMMTVALLLLIPLYICLFQIKHELFSVNYLYFCLNAGRSGKTYPITIRWCVEPLHGIVLLTFLYRMMSTFEGPKIMRFLPHTIHAHTVDKRESGVVLIRMVTHTHSLTH